MELEDVERLVGNWERDADQRAARYADMQQRVEQISITESVAGGAVSVTVGSNGIPTDVSMTATVRELAPDQIAGAVMSAMRKAQSRYPGRLAEILAETVGDDPAASHILATAERSFPAPPDDEDDEPAGDERMRFDDIQADVEQPSAPPRPRPATPAAEDDEDPGEDSIFDR